VTEKGWIRIGSWNGHGDPASQQSAERRAVEEYFEANGLRTDVLRSGDLRAIGPDEAGMTTVFARSRALNRADRSQVGVDSQNLLAFKRLSPRQRWSIVAAAVPAGILIVFVGDRAGEAVALALAMLVLGPILVRVVRGLDSRR
jgi:hypothetical protein